MSISPPLIDRAAADLEKHRVAVSSVVAAIVLTVLKLGVGISTQSLGILSEAAHSGLDLLAAGVTCWAVRVSGRPADGQHTYGHGKFENLSALFETLLLLLTCVWIIYESIERLFFTEVEVEVTVWAFLVIVLSIVVDVSRSRALLRVAKKYQSQALEADALHFSTDVWSSCVVLLGLLGVSLAPVLGLPWLAKADAVAALGVAGIVIWIGVQLGKKSIDDLLDSVPPHFREDAAEAASRIPGVEAVTQVRVRRSGPEIFADITLAIGQATPLETAHAIATRAEEAVRAIMPGLHVDVTAHVEPVAVENQGLLTTLQAAAARHGVAAHGVRIHQEKSQLAVELHLEVDDSLSLGEAHRLASDFENDVQRAVPNLTRIVTHLEPVGDRSAVQSAATMDKSEVRRVIQEYLDADEPSIRSHDLAVQWVGGELSVSFHCELDPSTAITAAHDLTDRLERHLRKRIPALGRVVIHVEPTEAP